MIAVYQTRCEKVLEYTLSPMTAQPCQSIACNGGYDQVQACMYGMVWYCVYIV